jgi:hypothetical protein
MQGKVSLSETPLVLDWAPERALPAVPAIAGCDRDFAGWPWEAGNITPGPWRALAHATSIEVTDLNGTRQR